MSQMQNYIQIVKPDTDHATYSQSNETLRAYDSVNSDLDKLTKNELKTMILLHIASGAAHQHNTDLQKVKLEQENARLRKSNVIMLDEVTRLRECFGYD